MSCGTCIYYWNTQEYVLWRQFCDPGCYCDGPPLFPPANPEETGYVYVACNPPELTTTPAPTTLAPTTTAAPTTTLSPTTTAAPTTTLGPTTTPAPTTTLGPTTTGSPECFGSYCHYQLREQDGEWHYRLIWQNCPDHCVCPPACLVDDLYGWYGIPEPDVYLSCWVKGSNLEEIKPPFRGCFYGVIALPVGIIAIPTTTGNPTTTHDPYTPYDCDYGEWERHLRYDLFYGLLLDGCDGNCPPLDLTPLNPTTIPSLAQWLYTQFPRDFISEAVVRDKLFGRYWRRSAYCYSSSWVLSSWVDQLSCPDRLYYRSDLLHYWTPQVTTTLPPSVTLAPGQCCCPGVGLPTTPDVTPAAWDDRYFPPFLDDARVYWVLFDEDSFPVGWVVVGDHYVDADGLHCVSEYGCFVYPCVVYESQS